MSAKVILVFCAQALFVQLALSSCVGRSNLGAGLASYGLSSPITPGLGLSGCAGPVLPAPVLPAPGCSGWGYNGIGYGNAGIGYGSGLGYGSNLALEVISTSGGSLPVSSSSLISPTGLSIVSENVFEGTLYVIGELPFVSAVDLEGEVPSGGAGTVSHSCGNGVTAIESIAPSAAAYGAEYGLGAAAAAAISANAGIGALGTGVGAYGAGIGAYGAGVAPLSLLPGAGCNAPVTGIVAPIDGCYPSGIYY